MESFIEILKVIFLGIVEGITEWLPISSTGHLILVEEFVKLNVSQEFWDMFMVVIQLGAIFAVVVLYWKDLWPFRNKKPKHENVTKVEKAAGVLCRFVKIDKMIMWFKILYPVSLQLLSACHLTILLRKNSITGLWFP